MYRFIVKKEEEEIANREIVACTSPAQADEGARAVMICLSTNILLSNTIMMINIMRRGIRTASSSEVIPIGRTRTGLWFANSVYYRTVSNPISTYSSK